MILRLNPPDSRATVVLLSIPLRVRPEDLPEAPVPSASRPPAKKNTGSK